MSETECKHADNELTENFLHVKSPSETTDDFVCEICDLLMNSDAFFELVKIECLADSDVFQSRGKFIEVSNCIRKKNNWQEVANRYNSAQVTAGQIRVNV